MFRRMGDMIKQQIRDGVHNESVYERLSSEKKIRLDKILEEELGKAGMTDLVNPAYLRNLGDRIRREVKEIPICETCETMTRLECPEEEKILQYMETEKLKWKDVRDKKLPEKFRCPINELKGGRGE